MVIDCFPFFNEIEILKIRLHIMSPFVDYFVITEARHTFSGKEKPLNFELNRSLFKDFEHKIIYNITEEDDITLSPFERDDYQKNKIKSFLKNFKDDDILIFSDVDEIPNPDILPGIFESLDETKVYHLAQQNCYFYLNFQEVSGNLLSYTGEFENVKEKKWLGTKICKLKTIKDIPITHLRHPKMVKCGIRVENGGWHFTYMGGDLTDDVIARIKHKIKSSAHQELNNFKVLSRVRFNLLKGKDIFGRKTEFKIVDIDDKYPKYIRDNVDAFSHLITKESGRNRIFSWPRFW